MSKKRYVVTGGAGFIGSHLVDELLKSSEARVVVFDAGTYAASLANLAKAEATGRMVLVEGDVANRGDVERLFENFSPDAVYHLAAESHVDRSIEGPREFIATNVSGTFEMLAGAYAHWSCLGPTRKADFRFVNVSTDEVYGSMPDGVEATEESRYEPNSPYSASKASADHIARAFHVTYGFPVITTHCSNNYGPRQYAEKLIPVIITRALDGQAIPVYGDGKHSRDWLYVTDHCRGLIAACKRGKPGEVYNFGARCELSTIEVVEAVVDELDRQRPSGKGSYRGLIKKVQDRPGHDRRYAIDPTKARRELGWSPAVFLAEGLSDTVRWYVSRALARLEEDSK